jgi:hypothetical protein
MKIILFIELVSALTYMRVVARADPPNKFEGETIMTKTNTLTQVSTMVAGLVLGLYGVLYVVHVFGVI